MHISIKIVCLWVAAMLSACAACYGWGMTGHRVVGEIAQRHLNRKAQKAVQAILGNESLAMSSNWADFIKSDSTYNYLGSWHYFNFQKGLDKDAFDAALQVDTIANAYDKLLFLVDELKNNRTLDLDRKKMYLRLIVHIVGDLHQPMHTARPEDLGGNRIKVYWFGQSSNLHQVWDEHLVNYQQLSYTEYADVLDHCTKAEVKQLQRAPVEQWLWESYTKAEELYKTIAPEAKLGYRYNFDHVEALNQCLLKGGVRLAGLLNGVFS